MFEIKQNLEVFQETKSCKAYYYLQRLREEKATNILKRMYLKMNLFISKSVLISLR